MSYFNPLHIPHIRLQYPHPPSHVKGLRKTRGLTLTACKLEPCKPYKKSRKSRRVRKNTWVPS